MIERSREQEARQDAEQQVHHLQKLESIGRLTGGIAHDFNNLLTVVIGSLDLLTINSRQRLDKKQRALIDDAVSAATAGAAITERLLAFARKKPLKPERFDSVRHVSQISNLLGRTVGERIEFDLNLPDTEIAVEADRGQLTTALLNVVINAREAIDDVGTVSLSIEPQSLMTRSVTHVPELAPGDYACIRIRDDGRGMNDAEIEQAFQPFFTTKELSEGAGLGLSMVYGFARQSGGTVKIESDPARGTTVTIYLPLVNVAADGLDTALPAQRNRSRGLAIVVEDQEEVRVVACAFLQSIGFDAIGAANAEEATALIQSGARPRFLFVDIVMPGPMDGLEFATWARRRLPGVEILLTTGYTDNDEQEECPFPILRKPYRVEELSAYLEARFGDGSDLTVRAG